MAPAEQATRRILTESGALLDGDHFVYVSGEHGSGWIDKDAVYPRTDRTSRLHLEDARDQIAKALDPKFAPPAPAGPTLPFGFPFMDDMMNVDQEPLVCWPDYVIRRSDN